MKRTILILLLCCSLLPTPAAADNWDIYNYICIDIPYFMFDFKGDTTFMGAGVGFYGFALFSANIEYRGDLSGKYDNGFHFFAGLGLTTLAQLQVGYGTDQWYFRIRSLLPLSRTFPMFGDSSRRLGTFAGVGLLVQFECSKRNTSLGTGLSLLF